VKSFPAFGILFGARSRLPELTALLEKHSGLPGPRGNLELAHAFATTVAGMHLEEWQWQWLVDMAAIPVHKAPTNTAAEYIPFCATVALGTLFGGGLPRPRRRMAMAALRAAAVDQRWRMREAAAQGLQRAGEIDPLSLRGVMDTWVEDPSPLVMRAVAAALAHPPVLENPEMAAYAVDAAGKLVDAFTHTLPYARKHDDFKTLRQGLGYALSVIVAAAPGPGFAMLKRAAAVRDPDLAWVIRENLKKKRITDAFPAECADVAAIAAKAAGGPPPTGGSPSPRKG
jgi:hypothetical protein